MSGKRKLIKLGERHEMKKSKGNILDAFRGIDASEELKPEVINMSTKVENITFNSAPDEIVLALNEFSEKHLDDVNYLKENHPAFFANVDSALSKKICDKEGLIIKDFYIKLFIRH